MDWSQRRLEAVVAVKARTPLQPKVGLILGSGLGDLADHIQDKTVIPYRAIPYFPQSLVPGHAGELHLGYLEGVPVAAMKGRFHYYEGYTMAQLALPVRVMHALGVQTLIVTNATGGLDPEMQPGDLMLVTDHLNFMFSNPLIGPNDDEVGPRFPDLAQCYSPRLRRIALAAAEAAGVALRQGVYVALTGPGYETRFTHRFLRLAGCSAVGMSLVPEVITAVHAGMEVLGISAITDVVRQEEAPPLTHADVMRVAEGIKPRFITLVRAVLEHLGSTL